MRRAVLAVLVGCSFPHGQLPTDASASSDDDASTMSDSAVTMIDAPAPSTALCFGTAPVRICFAQPLTTPLVISASRLVDGGSSCLAYTSPTNTDACVLAGSSITIENGATLTGQGSKPLILVSASTITIASGSGIDVSSRRGMPLGAAADFSGCGSGGNPGGGSTRVGGGWGGSFGAKGGDGGDSDAGDVGGTATGPLPAPTTLHGGCMGGNGGGAACAGERGHGGGAVGLIAHGTISISGTVNASGSAGGGAAHTTTTACGGGGGGSGGMIRLDAQTIAIGTSGKVFANGGGGGEGASTSNDGNPGLEPTAPNGAGAGGSNGAGSGGDGGSGSFAAMIIGFTGASGSNITGSGGGGGGSAGVIQVIGTGAGTTNTTLVAPPPT